MYNKINSDETIFCSSLDILIVQFKSEDSIDTQLNI